MQLEEGPWTLTRIVLSHKVVHPARVMICPHCDHKFSLSWGKYLSAPFGPHACPSCEQRFKIIVSVSSCLLLGAIAILAGGTPAVIAFFLTHNFWYTIAAYVLFAVGVVVPFDRYLTNTKRPVKPVE